MNPSYKIEADLKAAAKPLLKQLGKGWRLKIDRPLLNSVFRPNLVFKNTLTVYPVTNGFRASLGQLGEDFGTTAALAVKATLKTFQAGVPKLIQQIDAAFEVADQLLERPVSPFRDALRALCGAEPPAFVRGHHSHDYTDDENEKLQDWCGMHCRPHWATNLSMIEAAELIVEGAVDNANIPGEAK